LRLSVGANTLGANVAGVMDVLKSYINLQYTKVNMSELVEMHSTALKTEMRQKVTLILWLV
jgi:hypothetical protein